MTDDQFVRTVQDVLFRRGLYTGKIDGDPGPGTLRGLEALENSLPEIVSTRPAPDPTAPAPPVTGDPTAVDRIPDSGDAKLKGVNPVLVGLVQRVSLKSPIPFTIIEGLRTMERQREMVRIGASKTYNSKHLTGRAVDVWPLDPQTMKPLPSDAAYPRGSAAASAASARLWSDLRKIMNVAKKEALDSEIGATFGIDWGWDAPHIELK